MLIISKMKIRLKRLCVILWALGRVLFRVDESADDQALDNPDFRKRNYGQFGLSTK